MRPFLAVAALCCCIVHSASPCSAQQNQDLSNIMGEIRVARGSFPPHRINVALQLHGATVATVYADAEGSFLFRDLWPNIYYIVIQEEEYQPVHLMVVLRPANLGNGLIQITLTPKGETSSASSANSSGSGNPYLVDPAEYSKRFPKDAIKEFERGRKSDEKHKLDEAIEHYEKSVKLAPDFYPARNNLGLAYLGKANLQEAARQFKEVIRLNQADTEAWFNLGNLYLQTKQYPQALSAVQQGLFKQPDSAFGHFLLGSLYERTGQLQDSESSLREALRLDPQLSRVHLELVNLYLQQRKAPNAIAELRVFLKAFPRDPFAPKAKEVLKRLEGSGVANR